MATKKVEFDSKPAEPTSTEDKKKGGRPKKTPAERQENIIAVRFSTVRYEQIAAYARAGGRKMAAVVKEWMEQGAPMALTAEQHRYLRCLPGISNDLRTIAQVFSQQPDQQQQAAELLELQRQLGQLLASFH